MSAERLLAALQTPPGEPLPAELEQWLRDGLRAAVLERQALAESLELQGSPGRPDGPAQVRRWLRDAALLALGERLEPQGSPYRRAAAVFDAWHGARVLSDEDRPLLDLACRTAGMPAHLTNLAKMFRQRVGAETQVFDHFGLPRASGY